MTAFPLILLQGAGIVPLSGYLLCYAPLATIVLGLLTLFAFTDWHARRPYRRTNPYLMEEATAAELEGRIPPAGPVPTAPLGTTLTPFAVAVEDEDEPEAPAPALVAIAHVESGSGEGRLAREHVRLRNNGDALADLAGWTLRNANGHPVYTFPAVFLAPGAQLTIWSKAGANDDANLYADATSARWNPGGDTLILADAAGNEITRYSYRRERPEPT